MTIRLPKDLERFVHEAVRAGHYATDDDVIRDALSRLKESMPVVNELPDKKNAKPGKRAQRKKSLTPAEFDQHLLQTGLMSQLPETDADFDDPNDEPISIKGEALSETIIRERR